MELPAAHGTKTFQIYKLTNIQDYTSIYLRRPPIFWAPHTNGVSRLSPDTKQSKTHTIVNHRAITTMPTHASIHREKVMADVRDREEKAEAVFVHPGGLPMQDKNIVLANDETMKHDTAPMM